MYLYMYYCSSTPYSTSDPLFLSQNTVVKELFICYLTVFSGDLQKLSDGFHEYLE